MTAVAKALGQIDLTILLTTINEAENLSVLIPGLWEQCRSRGIHAEIVIVDGFSSDGTVAVAHSLGCRVVMQSGKGYAQAIRDGISAAGGEFVIVMDADGSHTPEDALRLYQNRQRADIIINSRYVTSGSIETQWHRAVLSRLLNFLYRRALGIPYREVSGGFRIYPRKLLQQLTLESKFYEVQEEILFQAHNLGYKALEIPYTYRPRIAGVSKTRTFKYGIHLLWAIIHLRRNRHRYQLPKS